MAGSSRSVLGPWATVPSVNFSQNCRVRGRQVGVGGVSPTGRVRGRTVVSLANGLGTTDLAMSRLKDHPDFT